MRVYIIAEAAATHDGDLDKAKELIQIAKDAGCDAVKFQWVSNPAKMAGRRHMANMGVYVYLYQPVGWHLVLSALAHQLGLDYLCTVFLPEDIPTIAPYVDRFKVASLESFDFDFLKAHEPFDKEIIVSTGCHNEAEYRALIQFTSNREYLLGEGRYALLHCIAAYPCPMDQMNFQWMYNQPLDGFSDHTGNVITGALAAILGATIIEVHFKSDSTKTENPDYPQSLWPAALREYIRNVRLAVQVCGDRDERTVLPCEEALLPHRVLPQ